MGILERFAHGVLGFILGAAIGVLGVVAFILIYESFYPPKNQADTLMNISWIFAIIGALVLGFIGFLWFCIASPFNSNRAPRNWKEEI